MKWECAGIFVHVGEFYCFKIRISGGLGENNPTNIAVADPM
jgi:hypothetical protein